MMIVSFLLKSILLSLTWTKANRLLLSREVGVEFKTSWNLLAETKIAAHVEGGENRKISLELSELDSNQ